MPLWPYKLFQLGDLVMYYITRFYQFFFSKRSFPVISGVVSRMTSKQFSFGVMWPHCFLLFSSFRYQLYCKMTDNEICFVEKQDKKWKITRNNKVKAILAQLRKFDNARPCPINTRRQKGTSQWPLKNQFSK